MSASFHMRGTTIMETERHRDGIGGYVRLAPDGDSVYPALAVHGDVPELRRLAAALLALADACETVGVS